MADANMPWSLKGVSDEAREYARQAASDAAMPIGSWLSTVIQAAALQEQSASAPITDDADDMLANIVHIETVPRGQRGPGGNTIERAVEIVSTMGLEPEGPARDEDLIEDIELIQLELDDLERRVAEMDGERPEKVAPLLAEIDRLRRRLASLEGG